jgi:FSR family fosmidomycin resistance protein-like MFS transporter
MKVGTRKWCPGERWRLRSRTQGGSRAVTEDHRIEHDQPRLQGRGALAPPGTAVAGATGITVGTGTEALDRGYQPGDRLQLGVVSLSHTVQHLYPGALAVAYPYVIATYHVSYGTLGVVLGVAGVVGGLLQGAAGFVERVSSRLLLALQNLGLAFFTVLGAVAPGFAAFAAARLGGGVASWPQHPIGNALLVRRFPRRRAFVLACHTAGGSLGTAIAPIITGALIAAYGWRIGLGVFALPMALGGLVVAFFLADSSGPVASSHERGSPVVRLRDVATRREVIGALAAGTIAAAGRGLGALSTYVPAYLKTGLHFSPIEVGGLFTVVVIGSIIGPIAAGRVADRLGRSFVLAGIYAIGALCMAAFVLVGRDRLLVGGVGLLLGAFAYSESPLLQAVFSDAVEGAPQRGAFGLFFAISYGVGALWLPLIGWTIDAAGFHTAFYLMAASFVAAAAVIVATGGPGGRRRGTPAPERS